MIPTLSKHSEIAVRTGAIDANAKETLDYGMRLYGQAMEMKDLLPSPKTKGSSVLQCAAWFAGDGRCTRWGRRGPVAPSAGTAATRETYV